MENKIDEVVKALKCLASYQKEFGVCFISDKRDCQELLVKTADLLEQLKAENERLKASQPVRCGECEFDERCLIQETLADATIYEFPDKNIDEIYCSYGKRRVEE